MRTEHSDYLAYDRSLAAARQRLPEGSCDCHAHLFEDETRFPYRWPRLYTPVPARVVDYEALRDAYGIDRMVLVHGTPYGADHASFECLLARHGAWMRGVAVVGPSHTRADVERWHALGARATRVNLLLTHGTATEWIDGIVALVRPLGWHLELLCDIARDAGAVRALAERGCTVVVDHMGMAPPAASLDSPGLRDLCALMREGRAWVKASAGYRLSDGRPGMADVRPLVDRLLEAACGQVVWGTNWPHPLCETRMPNDGEVVDAVFEWFESAAVRQMVLVDNPARLYWGGERWASNLQ